MKRRWNKGKANGAFPLRFLRGVSCKQVTLQRTLRLLGKQDWRDLLVEAGFADRNHRQWLRQVDRAKRADPEDIS